MALSIYHRDNFGLLAPVEHVLWQRVMREQVSSKYGTWYCGPMILQFIWSWRSRWFHFARYTVLTSPNKDETVVHGYGSTFIGSCRAGDSQSNLFT